MDAAPSLSPAASTAGAGVTGVDDVRVKLDTYLRDNNVYDQLRGLISQFSTAGKPAGVSAPLVAALVRQHGEAFSSLMSPPAAATATAGSAAGTSAGDRDAAPSESEDTHADERPVALAPPVPADAVELVATAGLPASTPGDTRQLVVAVNGGRAFTAHLHSDPPAGSRQFYVLHAMLGSQRFRSQAVPAGVEPAFQCRFVMDLVPPGTVGVAGVASLLSWRNPVALTLTCVTQHGVVTEEASDKHTGPGPSSSGSTAQVSVDLVSTVDLEWRTVLSRGRHTLTVELPGVGDEAKLGVPIGALQVDLQLLPSVGPGSRFSQTDIARQARAENELEAAARRKFFKYAREWWANYRESHPSFESRLVKIFAEDESCLHQPVVSFVQPVDGGRLLPSPRHAARFVSLLPFRRVEPSSTSGQSSSRWHSVVTTLALRFGDAAAHATLLCSLLLGFGLEAFVVMGTRLDAKGLESDHVWVMTRDDSGDDGSTAVFWETLTGQRLKPTATTPSGHRFLRIGCVFNDTAFFANKQPNDLVEAASFDFEDDRAWKSMDPALLRDLRQPPAVPLTPPTLNEGDVAAAVETDLKAHIASLRDSLSLTAVFDPKLEFLLGGALAVYELERVTSLHISNPEFQQGLRKLVPTGYTFKAFPIVFNHLSPTRIMAALKAARVAQDILGTRGDNTKFGVRVAVHAYPEDFCAVWVMLAVVTRPL